MIDMDTLKGQYRLAVMACLGITAVPLLLAAVAKLLAASPDSTSAGFTAIHFAVFSALALSPVVSASIVRRLSNSALEAALACSEKAESSMMVFAVTEYALWEISSLLGFVAFVLGAPWYYFAACIGVSLAGFAFSFPRWSAWVTRARELGAADGEGIIIPA